MDVKIDPQALQTIVADALLRQLDEGKRETLIKAAIAHLMNPSTDSWSRGVSPIEQAFRQGAEQCAREIVKAEMEKPAIRDFIAGAVTKAFAKALSNEGDLVENMARSITSAISFKER